MTIDKSGIEKQAKKIMDDFLDSLHVVDQLHYEVGTERDIYLRQQGETIEETGFNERMLKNAPKTKDGYIQAEKKKW